MLALESNTTIRSIPLTCGTQTLMSTTLVCGKTTPIKLSLSLLDTIIGKMSGLMIDQAKELLETYSFLDR